MKKIVLSSLAGCLLLFIVSCTSTQFSRTERSYKNGHVVYKNKHQKEIRPDHAKKVKSQKQKEERSNLAHDPHVNSNITQIPRDKETVLASSSGDFLILNIDPVIIDNGRTEPVRKNENDETNKIISSSPSGNQISINPDTIVKKQDTNNYVRGTVYQPNQPPRKIEGFGVAGTITGIVGLFIAGIPLGIISLIFGFVCLTRVKKNPKKRMGKGFGLAAIILGIVDVVGTLIVLSMMY